MQKKSGFVSIIGAPNAGKSTLMNALVGENLSIVTSNPQTTRNRVFGILTEENTQVVFVDTPGILDPRYKLQQYMASEVSDSFDEADAVLVIYDISKDNRSQLEMIFEKFRKQIADKKLLLVINKIDCITKEELLIKIGNISAKFKFDEIIPVSAKKTFNIEELKKVILALMPEGEFYYNADVITSQPEKFFVSEIIRQQAFKMFREEIPFSIFVMINEFKERERGKDYVNATIYVERESQKGILIGSDGNMIKALGEKSRARIEEFLGREVYLELFVKVSDNWKDNESFVNKNIKASGKPAS